ncbi:amylo-alpha-1,6-glucosidase [Desulfosediminicola flagellatus]|uniref:amylo-alpha-1,6-glucosidase n=1 Tax=Desulfosediminicola flagellatus TaxID=2569541 RepID=UPI001592DE37|nr:amylo-alpha-1,6-glucosidase [Desulfosediminicola flagellatus]
MEEVIRINDDWYVKAGSSRSDLQTRILKDGEAFAIFDRFGDIQSIGLGEQGIFFEGTRYLSQLEMLINERRPMLLNSSTSHDNTLLAIDLTTPDMYDAGQLYLGKGKLHIFRSKLLWNDQYYENIRFTNYDQVNFSFNISFFVDSDYVDIFEIRGVERAKRGVMQELESQKCQITLGYTGLDSILYQTHVEFDPAPARIKKNLATYSLSLNAQESKEICLRVSCSKQQEVKKTVTFTESYESCCKKAIATRTAFVDVFTSNEQFNDWLGRSAADLRLLISDTGNGLYPYAGIPWFCTPFGRDGIITALQSLWIYPDLARGVLQYLAYHQATECLPDSDAEPGKILHETRKGEMAALQEIPFAHYYGSVDSTPLFLVLAGRYFDRTSDIEFIKKLWPNLLAALEWIEKYGDLDNDGFVEYERKCARGILQQGWKDSNDSIFHEDGSNVTGSVALCEVQGYVYDAKIQMSRLAGLLNYSDMSTKLELEAAALKEKFHEHFWLDDLQTYAIALDGDKNQCRVRSSNAGHTLFSNIAREDVAKTVVQTLLSPNSFSDWGIRTIAAGESRYNPMSYHNGSVWPHDNALIALGMAQYGFMTEASLILTGLFNTAIAVDLQRLPELFCGFHKRHDQAPTLYPVACAPQAWASGAIFMMLQATLGLTFSHRKPEIRFKRPFLPDYMDSIRISNLKVSSGEVDLLIQRNLHKAGVHLIRKTGDVEVAVVM